MTESLAIILKLHTPDELQLYSNIGHWIEGGLFLIIAGIAFVQAFGYLHSQRAQYLWPVIILVAGIFLPLFSFSHHFNELTLAWKATIYDPQQLQHMIMAILITIAGVAEVAYLRGQGKNQLLRFVFPLVVGIIGIMFITHPQHGTSEAVLRAVTIHKYLGTVLIFAGIFKALEVIKKNTQRWLTFSWIFFLTIAAILLISYREPEGAYMLNPTMNEVMPQMNQAQTTDKIVVTVVGFIGMAFTYWFFLMKNEKEVAVYGSVDITVEGGYSPEVISIPKGKTTKISFIRKDPSSCLEEVVLGDFKVRKYLPLNQKVTVELTPQKSGEFVYACGMNMYHGKIIVK